MTVCGTEGVTPDFVGLNQGTERKVPDAATRAEKERLKVLMVKEHRDTGMLEHAFRPIRSYLNDPEIREISANPDGKLFLMGSRGKECAAQTLSHHERRGIIEMV